MRFIIQFVRTSKGSEEVLDCVEIDELSAKRARTKGQLLMSLWRKDGANSFRLMVSPKRATGRLKAS